MPPCCCSAGCPAGALSGFLLTARRGGAGPPDGVGGAAQRLGESPEFPLRLLEAGGRRRHPIAHRLSQQDGGAGRHPQKAKDHNRRPGRGGEAHPPQGADHRAQKNAQDDRHGQGREELPAQVQRHGNRDARRRDHRGGARAVAAGSSGRRGTGRSNGSNRQGGRERWERQTWSGGRRKWERFRASVLSSATEHRVPNPAPTPRAGP